MTIWSLSGVDADRWFVAKGSMWRAPVNVRGKVLETPGRHGVRTYGVPEFDEPQVKLVLEPMHPSLAELEAAEAELVALLSAPGLTLTRALVTYTGTAAARLVSVVSDEFEDATPWARFEVALAVPSVFFRGVSADSASQVVVSGNTYSLPHLASSTGPVSDAVLRFAGPLSSATAIDPVTSTGISWTGALAAGEFVFLHPASLTARLSTSATAWATGGEDVSSGVSRAAAGPLQIWPRMADTDPGVRAAELTVTGTGFAGTTALVVRAQPSYL